MRKLTIPHPFSVLAFTLLAFAPLVIPGVLAQSDAPKASCMPIGKAVELKAPLGLPPVPIPGDNPLTEETIALGRRLYYDPALSVDGTISCASCHAPEFSFSDNRPVSDGVG